jgi:hypothetical protein
LSYGSRQKDEKTACQHTRHNIRHQDGRILDRKQQNVEH